MDVLWFIKSLARLRCPIEALSGRSREIGVVVPVVTRVRFIFPL